MTEDSSGMYCALYCVCVRLSRSFGETVEVNVSIFTTTGNGAIGSGGKIRAQCLNDEKVLGKENWSFESFQWGLDFTGMFRNISHRETLNRSWIWSCQKTIMLNSYHHGDSLSVDPIPGLIWAALFEIDLSSIMKDGWSRTRSMIYLYLWQTCKSYGDLCYSVWIATSVDRQLSQLPHSQSPQRTVKYW